MTPYFFNRLEVLNQRLIYAAENGLANEIAPLVTAGAQINCINNYHETPLFLAVEGCHLNTVKRILEYNGNPNISDDYHETPLHLAYENNHHAIINCLLAYGADPNIRNLNNERPKDVPCLQQKLNSIPTYHSKT